MVHGVSWCFTALFHAVSLLLHAASLLFHAVSRCFTALFHDVSSLCLMMFQGVSLPCFILFHDHETGAVGTNLKSDKLAYKLRVKDEMRRELSCYSNDLHEALLEKAVTDFWKYWRSKFGDKNATTCNVNGLADESSIAAKFAEYFANFSRGNSEARCSKLKEEYTDVRHTYIGET